MNNIADPRPLWI